MWLLMMRPFFNQALKNYIQIWIQIYRPTYRLSAFKYKELLIIGIGRNFHICASLVINNVLFQFIPEVQIKVI